MFSRLLNSRSIRSVTIAVAAGGTAAAVACADNAPTAPHGAAPSAAIATTGTSTSGSTVVGVQSLMRTTPLASSITRSVTLTGSGGTLQIPEVGLMVVIPRGAVGDTTVTITATALAGSAVAYNFEPHGAQFATQLQVKQALSGTTWAGNTGMTKVTAGYFADPSQVNISTGTAQVNEQISGTVAGSTFQFPVGHFSGYLMSSN